MVEINKAAEQEEGKPVFPLQHSIYAELEEVHARQTAEKQQSETADDSASSAGTAPEYGAQNKLVTTEQYEELKRRMREKLGQLNAGFDPEILSIGAQMAAYHVEAGARRFADFSRRMIADLGDVIRPYLKPIYTAAAKCPAWRNMPRKWTATSRWRRSTWPISTRPRKHPSRQEREHNTDWQEYTT